ncbi:hypothetical protein B0J15DRAFT_401065 [Fusarium solani]|uniref:Uncharacterized protein n=1 Tax=Fusarium solani TaxID=169388 RepID=A0A9P9K8X6_FUSSL|nr:uncharacterized protein B0J15DRAFT_401065 [Fusarium solani]KAH7248415.1 hypothetical protein B0J15DRAFT_401065 [Fusarium solani]
MQRINVIITGSWVPTAFGLSSGSLGRQELTIDPMSGLHEMKASILCFLRAYSTVQVHDPAAA